MKFVTENIVNETPVIVNVPTNRIIVVDCSGSMGSALPQLRTHLKNKLPTMVLPDDTLTIIWFSSKNEFGVLFEAVNINSLTDLSNINTAIDRFLRPTGLTGFKQPLEEVLKLTQKLQGPSTMSFMTDGYENQWSKKDVIAVCNSLSNSLASATFVEYGYYADHGMLMDMAEEVGGSVVMAEDFTKYSETLGGNLRSNNSGKKIKINKITAPYVIGNVPDGFVIAKPDAVGTVTLPANTVSYSYLSGTGAIDSANDLKAAAYGVAALIMRGEADKALELTSVIGDVPLYKQVENSFSKQDYSRSVDLAKSYGTGNVKLFSTEPRKTDLIPDENAYNILTLLLDVSEGEGNYLNISHPEFTYNAIGNKRDTAEVGDTGFVPVFVDASNEIKAEINALKFDEDRPNISILVKRPGKVSLPPNDYGFDGSIDSFIWRNYTIVKDGIVNVKKLPLILSKSTYDLLTQVGVIDEPFKVGKTFVIDTTKFPVINRGMATPTKASDLFAKCFQLYQLRAIQKVMNSKIEKPAFGQNFASLYGEEGAAFLKNLGISEGGFSPKTVKGESVDAYISKVLEVKLSGLSSIPTVDAVEKAIAANKTLTPSQKVLSDAINYVESVTDIGVELASVKDKIKNLLREIVMIKFGIILGRKWFTDMKSFEDNSLDMDFKLGKITTCTAVLSDKEV